VDVTHDALRRYYPNGRYWTRLQPLPGHGCIFVKNPKAASSTVLLWLHRIHTGDHEWAPALNIHREHRLPRPAEVGWEELVRMLAGGAYRFTFVRDPIRRAESAYLSKVADMERKDDWRNKVRAVLGLPQNGGQVSFDQFVAALEAEEPIRMDAHWRPQHLNLMHPLVEYDYVGRLETFGRDLARIRAEAGLPDTPLEMRNPSERSRDVFHGRWGLLRRVRDVYARDLELYGY
jgi:Sulfotransferase family